MPCKRKQQISPHDALHLHLQVVANIFEWPKLQATLEKSFLFQEFVQPRPGVLSSQPMMLPTCRPFHKSQDCLL
jgi:hypothetical protein